MEIERTRIYQHINTIMPKISIFLQEKVISQVICMIKSHDFWFHKECIRKRMSLSFMQIYGSCMSSPHMAYWFIYCIVPYGTRAKNTIIPDNSLKMNEILCINMHISQINLAQVAWCSQMSHTWWKYILYSIKINI